VCPLSAQNLSFTETDASSTMQMWEELFVGDSTSISDVVVNITVRPTTVSPGDSALFVFSVSRTVAQIPSDTPARFRIHLRPVNSAQGTLLPTKLSLVSGFLTISRTD
jgi:hypothetical protein